MIALSAAELDLLCGLLALEAPDALDLDRRRASPASGVRDGLAGRGLLHGPAPAPRIAATVRRLCRAPLAVELRRHGPDPLAAVVAVDAAHAVLAVRHDDGVVLRALSPERAVAAVPGLIEPLPPAAGRPVRVPVAVLTGALAAAGDDAHRLVVELMRRGMSAPGARALVDANQEVDAVFRIGVTLRHTDGPHHGPYRITVQHNAYGHHCQRPSAGPPEALVTVPATADSLTLEIDELVRATADGQRRGAGRGSTRPVDAGGIGSDTGASTW